MTPPKRVFACGRCTRKFKTGEERIHSDWSGLSYCTDVDACGRRARRVVNRPEITWRASERSMPPSRRR